MLLCWYLYLTLFVFLWDRSRYVTQARTCILTPQPPENWGWSCMISHLAFRTSKSVINIIKHMHIVENYYSQNTGYFKNWIICCVFQNNQKILCSHHKEITLERMNTLFKFHHYTLHMCIEISHSGPQISVTIVSTFYFLETVSHYISLGCLELGPWTCCDLPASTS